MPTDLLHIIHQSLRGVHIEDLDDGNRVGGDGGSCMRARRVWVATTADTGTLQETQITNGVDLEDGVGVEVYYSASSYAHDTTGLGRPSCILPEGCDRVSTEPVQNLFLHPNILSPCAPCEPEMCGTTVSSVHSTHGTTVLACLPRYPTTLLGHFCLRLAPVLSDLPRDAKRLIEAFLPQCVSRIEVHLTAPRLAIEKGGEEAEEEEEKGAVQ